MDSNIIMVVFYISLFVATVTTGIWKKFDIRTYTESLVTKKEKKYGKGYYKGFVLDSLLYVEKNISSSIKSKTPIRMNDIDSINIDLAKESKKNTIVCVSIFLMCISWIASFICMILVYSVSCAGVLLAAGIGIYFLAEA